MNSLTVPLHSRGFMVSALDSVSIDLGPCLGRATHLIRTVPHFVQKTKERVTASVVKN